MTLPAAMRLSPRALRALWRRQLGAQAGASGPSGGGGDVTGAHTQLVALLDALRRRAATCVPPPPWRTLEHTRLVPPGDVLDPSPVFVGYSCEGLDAALDRCFPLPPHDATATQQQQQPLFLGFDLEYTPTFVRGMPMKRTALVQVASARDTVLAHLYHLPCVPPSLDRLMRRRDVVLVGVAVSNDVDKLAADYGVARGANFVDVGVVAELYGYSKTGLKSLCAAFGVAVTKSVRVQCGNWERVPLRQQQVEYAALDAQLSLWLLHQLHATHARHVPLHAWAQPFVNATTLRAVLDSKHAARSPLAHAIAQHRHEARVQQQSRERARAESRMQAAVSRGLQNPELALGALSEIALARKASITWDDTAAAGAHAAVGDELERLAAAAAVVGRKRAGHAAASQQEFIATVALDSSVLGTGAGKTKKLARRTAAVNALRALAMAGVSVDAPGATVALA